MYVICQQYTKPNRLELPSAEQKGPLDTDFSPFQPKSGSFRPFAKALGRDLLNNSDSQNDQRGVTFVD